MYTTRNLLLTFYSWWETSGRWPPAFATRCVKRFTKLSKTGQLLICVRKFIPNNTLRLLYCVGRLLCRHASFKNRRMKKSVPQGQENLQALRYPTRAKRSSSLPTAPAHCHWTHFEMACLRLFLRVQTVPHNRPCGATVFSEKCHSTLHHSLYSDQCGSRIHSPEDNAWC